MSRPRVSHAKHACSRPLLPGWRFVSPPENSKADPGKIPPCRLWCQREGERSVCVCVCLCCLAKGPLAGVFSGCFRARSASAACTACACVFSAVGHDSKEGFGTGASKLNRRLERQIEPSTALLPLSNPLVPHHLSLSPAFYLLLLPCSLSLRVRPSPPNKGTVLAMVAWDDHTLSRSFFSSSLLSPSRPPRVTVGRCCASAGC